MLMRYVGETDTVMLMPRHLFASIIACSIALATLTSSASAQSSPNIEDLSESDSQALLQHLDDGRTNYEAGKFVEALAAFQSAYALFPHPDVLYRVAECQEKLAQDAEAAASYRKFLEQVPDAKERPRIEGVIKLLDERANTKSIARIEIKSTPAGALVSIDGEPRGETPLELELEPGEVSLELTLRGYAPVKEALEVEAGKSLALRYPMAPTRTQNGSGANTPALAAAGVGALGLVSATTFYLLYNSAARDVASFDAQKSTTTRPPSYNDRVTQRNRYGTLAIVSVSATAVAAGAATFLFIRGAGEDNAGEDSARALDVRPALAPGHAGAVLTFDF